MSEKRFYLLSYKNYPIYDSVEDKEYNARFRKQREKLCDLLNEWVTRCNQLEEKNRQLKEDNEKWKRFANMEFIKGSTEIGRLNKNIADLKKEKEMLKLKLKKYEDAEFERTQARGW